MKLAVTAGKRFLLPLFFHKKRVTSKMYFGLLRQKSNTPSTENHVLVILKQTLISLCTGPKDARCPRGCAGLFRAFGFTRRYSGKKPYPLHKTVLNFSHSAFGYAEGHLPKFEDIFFEGNFWNFIYFDQSSRHKRVN